MQDTNSVTALFNLVQHLIPSDQILATIPYDMAVEDAIRIMGQHGYSQLPVVTWEREVLGVFSYRSFSKAVLELEYLSEPIRELPVEDFMERWRYVAEDDNWESVLSLLDSYDGVLIGSRRDVQGIVTTMDLASFLRQVARPFVLLAEIELTLRRIIDSCIPQDKFSQCVSDSLTSIYGERTLPKAVAQMTFNDYVQLIGNGRNWPYFEAFFGMGDGTRKRTRNTLSKVGELRNVVFHFKQSLEDDDMRILENKRNWLKDKAHRFEGEQRRVES